MSQGDIPLSRVESQGYNNDIEMWKRKKTIALPTAEQKDFLINFVMENHAVMYNKDNKKYDKQKRTKKWKELTSILNSMDGPKKSPEQWKASWNAVALRARTAVARGDTNYGDRVAAVIAFLYPDRPDLHRKMSKDDEPLDPDEAPPSEEFTLLPETEPPPNLSNEELFLPPKPAFEQILGKKLSLSQYKIEQEKLEFQKKLLALEEKQTIVEELRANVLERMLKREETKINDSTRILLQTKRLEIAYRQAKEEEATSRDIVQFVLMTEAKSKLLLDVLTKVTEVINMSY